MELDHGEELERDGYRIAAFDTDHGVPAQGYALVEDSRPGRFDEERARELGVEPGPDFGRLQRGEAVGEVTPDQVLGEARPGRKLVITGDTAPSELVAAVAHRADLLVHEATFTEEDAERAAETRHSTARGAGALAAEAEVKLLALTHLSARYPVQRRPRGGPGRVRGHGGARRLRPIELPLPERGEPVHHRERSS